MNAKYSLLLGILIFISGFSMHYIAQGYSLWVRVLASAALGGLITALFISVYVRRKQMHP
jgi:membrane associated rhomboid family serine protease